MKGRRQPARRTGARLFLVYAIASLVPVLALGALLVRHEQKAGAARGLAQGHAQARTIMQMAIAPALDRRDLSQGLSAGERQRLREATDLAVYSGSLTAVRLRTFSGQVVFADDGSDTDPLPPSDDAFQTAAFGGSSVAVVHTPHGGPGSAIRVVQPVVPNATGQATGVLELYLPYGPIAAIVHNEERQTYVRLAEGLAVLYVVLAAISWYTTWRLQQYAAEQERQARRDPLTDLPNRAWFRELATDAIEEPGARGAIALVDLDRFKEVNDTLGHHAGDELLQRVAQRLIGALRTDDVVARLGGDEFGVLLPGLVDPDAALGLVRDVQRHLGEEITIDGAVLTIEASFGVALYPEHGADVSLLMRNADAAMYEAKRGSDRIVVWQPEFAPPATHWHVVLGELQRALDKDELVLHYQPKLALPSGEIAGVEALVRWQHPERGLLPPSEFIPVAESSMLIHPLSSWVLRRALSDQQQWQRRGLAWAVAVNVSAHNLESSFFVDEIRTILAECSARPQDLILELTETALAADNESVESAMGELQEIGVQVSLDDFGRGSTGLLQLRRVPVHEIKIDAAFVRELAANPGDKKLVRAMVELAHGMGARVVAEGVEDAQSAEWLRAAGCDGGQGYYFQHPVPWPELVERYAADDHLVELGA